MIEKEFNGIQWLEFELFESFPKLNHGIFLNTNDPLEILGGETLSLMRQVHGNHVVEANGLLKEADAQITDRQKMALGIYHADCQAALFYDPICHALAAVHAGWRGSVQKIYTKTVKQMAAQFGSDPKNLLVAISPSLGPKSAEFIHYKKELPDSFWKYKLGVCHFDFWQISQEELLDAGVKIEHLQIAGIDTCQDRRFHSYRLTKTCSRNLTAALLQ